jgi:SAM-dependent methyltransferase
VAADRRLSFGQVAELYDLARPSYPPALVDDVLAFAGASAGYAAVEVGAGTGKATILFAERGLEVLALEPSAEMAEIARSNTAGFPKVAVEEIEFEHWRADRPFKLLYSAQAWHWIEPRLRFVRAAQALAADGVIAAFWNRVRWESSPLRAELDDAYRRLAPELGGPVGAGPMRPTAVDSGDWVRDWRGDAPSAPGFTEPEWRSYGWVQPYTTSEYLSLLQTHSDHGVLEAPRRRALLDAVGRTIDHAGGVLEIHYVTRLGLARRRCGSEPADG